MQEVLVISDNLVIPVSELEFRFSRSSGPGGQHVNKVSSRVVVSFDVLRAPELSDEQRQRILHSSRSRIGSDGKMRFASQQSRSQWKNREFAVNKLAEHLRDILRPGKKREPTRASQVSRERRLRRKGRQARKKMMRRHVLPDD